MVLRLYSSNQPVLLATLPLLAAAGAWPIAHGPGVLPVPTHYPGDLWLREAAQSPLWLALLATGLISAGALLTVRIINRNQFYPAPVVLPGLVYVAMALVLSVRGISLSALAGNLFLLAGVGRALGVYREPRVLAQYFEAGLLIGCAALLYPPFLLAGAGLWLSVLYTRAFRWREYAVSLLGLLAPFVWWVALAFVSGSPVPRALFVQLTTGGEGAPDLRAMDAWTRLALGATALTAILALPRFLFPRERVSNKARNTFSVFLLFSLSVLAALVLEFALSRTLVLQALAAPLAVISGLWYTNYRYSLVAPFLFYGWVALIALSLCRL